MTWHYDITRVPENNAIACFGIAAGQHPGAAASLKAQKCSRTSGCSYLIRTINPDTGEVRDRHACVNHAAWLANNAGLPFPPIIADAVPATRRKKAA